MAPRHGREPGRRADLLKLAGRRPITLGVSARRTADEIAWLRRGPSATELRSAYPGEWAAVQRDVGPMVAAGDLARLEAYVQRLATPASRSARRQREAAVTALVRRQIAAAVLRQAVLAAATGKTEGRVRFNLLNGLVAQRLLFRTGLERKPVSRFWFRLLWPLVWQRDLLMPLVGPKGIYCFYSRPLVRRLATMIGERSCVEIAAGDGTLSRFLADEGVDVVATDDHSWVHAVDYPDEVANEDARTALRTRAPEVVLCSWPPAGNAFEAAVFQTPSVQLYVVIGSRAEFATGARDAWAQQTAFSVDEDEALSALVLPPELDPAVYVFRRRVPDGA